MSVTAKSITWYAFVAVVVSALAFAAFRFGHPVFATLIVVIPASLVVNGFVAETEDSTAGGLNNPYAKSQPKKNSQDSPDA
jgi:uncharacterized membrane protein YccC